MVMLEEKMINLENISDYTKAVLAIVIGEQVMRMLPKGDGFLHSRKTLDLCWKCIEEWEKVARDVIGDICYCIDPEDDIEFEYYSDISGDAAISNIYMLLLGIASYIDAQVMLLQVSSVPQYFELVCDDEGYTKYILDFAKKVNDNFFEEFKLQQVLTYCNNKQNEKGNIRFQRDEILNLIS